MQPLDEAFEARLKEIARKRRLRLGRFTSQDLETYAEENVTNNVSPPQNYDYNFPLRRTHTALDQRPEPELLESHDLSHLRLQGEEESIATNLIAEPRSLSQGPSESISLPDTGRNTVNNTVSNTGSNMESNTERTGPFETAAEQSNEQAGDLHLSAQSFENVPPDMVSETERTQEIKLGGFFFKLGRHINRGSHRLIIGPKLEAGITNTGRPFLSLIGEVTTQPEFNKFQLDFPNGSGNQMNFDLYWKKTHLFFEKGYTGSIPYAQGGILRDCESFLKKIKLGNFPYHCWGVGIKNKGSFWLWQDSESYYFLGATDEFRKNVPGVPFLGVSFKIQSAFTLPHKSSSFLFRVKPIPFLSKQEEIRSAIEDQTNQAQECCYEIKSTIEDLDSDLPNSGNLFQILGGSFIIQQLSPLIWTSLIQVFSAMGAGFFQGYIFYEVSLLEKEKFKNKSTASFIRILRYLKYGLFYGSAFSATFAFINVTYNFVWNKPLFTKFQFLNTTSKSHLVSKQAFESLGYISEPVQVFFETQWAFVKPYFKEISTLIFANPLWGFSFAMVGSFFGNLPWIFIGFRIYRTRSISQGIWIIVCFGLMFSRRSFFQEFLVAEKCPSLFSDKEMTKKENLQELAKICRICVAGIIKGFGLGWVVNVTTNRLSPVFPQQIKEQKQTKENEEEKK